MRPILIPCVPICAAQGRASAVPSISLQRVGGSGSQPPRWLTLAAPALDRLLGLSTLDREYHRSGVRGLPPLEFASDALRVLGITPQVVPADLSDRIPAQGPVLVVSNHPFGGVEALVLAHVLRKIRPDVRFLANAALGVFSELRPAIIPTDSLTRSQRNVRSIRSCQAHLDSGGLLVVFPAGKVSVYHTDGARYADADWNRLVGHLVRHTGASVVPVFFDGRNSRLFKLVGRIWERARIALLARELLGLRGRTVKAHVGRPIASHDLKGLTVDGITRFARLMAYVLEPEPVAAFKPADRLLEPIAPPAAREELAREVASLPASQRLVAFKHYSVFFAHAPQVPQLVQEIARERERVFRSYAEGSGAARDTDVFDQTYVQLFVWDHTARSIVGAYRLGRTDELLARDGPGGLYLAQMFEFDPDFHRSDPPALELGRSFVVPEHQRSFHALYLLWRGIGSFLLAHPQYTRLYGTVSLSRQYNDQAIAMLCDALIEPSALVRPHHPLRTRLLPEWRRYRQGAARPSLPQLSALVRSLDAEGKDLPVLLRHYHGLGARFHCVGVDPHFSDTPGLLLSVDMTTVPRKVAQTFLGDGAAEYLARRPTDDSSVRARVRS